MADRKTFWIFSACVLVVSEIAVLIVRGFVNSALGEGFSFTYVDVFARYNSLPYGWILYVIFALAVVGGLVGSYFYILRQEKPRDF
jgi:hypothetical protein